MELKMTEEKIIQMMHLYYPVGRRTLTVAQIAAEVGVSSSTVSRWRWSTCAQIYQTITSGASFSICRLISKDVMEKYQINEDQLQRIVSDMADWNKERQEFMHGRLYFSMREVKGGK